LSVIAKQGRLRITLAQLARNRRFKCGRGLAPLVGVGGGNAGGWSDQVDLREVETINPPSDGCEVAAIDDLLTRWLRATILGGRAWGAGYYGWSMISGLQALLLNVACVGWLARLHAAGRPSPSPSAGGAQTKHDNQPRERAGVRVQHHLAAPTPSPPAPLPRDSCEGAGSGITIIDIRAALGRIDRTAGRAKWLGSSAERLRLAYLNMDDGLRRLLQRYTATPLIMDES
jgi:hypothetical protein